MRTIARMTVAGALVLAALGTSTGSAHTGWSVEGSFQASVRYGCGYAPSCVAFTTAQNVAGQACSPSLANPNGIDTSIVQLPFSPGNVVHRARLTWNAQAGPVSIMSVGGIAPFGAVCLPVGETQIENENFPPAGAGTAIVQIDPRAKFLFVNGENAFNVTWKLQGIDD